VTVRVSRGNEPLLPWKALCINGANPTRLDKSEETFSVSQVQLGKQSGPGTWAGFEVGTQEEKCRTPLIADAQGEKWWRCRDLNPGPCGYEPHALTN
jgi:hypothetical protein